ncbi:MAG: type IV toxin-antitoxin system AbiEi family antitoxin domain-containing protein [Solirubrobacteraceae bacterium]
MAGGQHGVITYEQLLRAGLSHQAVRTRVGRGQLHRVYRGVYRVGHCAPSVQATYLAAVLACGPRAFLGGPAAAHAYGLRRDAPPRPEVVAPVVHHHPGVVTRRRALHRLDTTEHRAIPILTIPALLVDLAGVLSLEDLAAITHEADVRFNVRGDAIEAAMPRRPTARGIASLRAIARGDHALLLSRLERRFRRLLRDARLPLPVTNRREGAHYVDCRCPDRRLTVELDSYRWHNSRHAWEADHERRRAARARGDQFRAYTWRDVTEQPGPMLAELRELLVP